MDRSSGSEMVVQSCQPESQQDTAAGDRIECGPEHGGAQGGVGATAPRDAVDDDEGAEGGDPEAAWGHWPSSKQ
jgi:hypothetical protein